MIKPHKKSSHKTAKPTVNEGFQALVGAGVVMLLASLCMAVSTVHI
jgi:hypothetical protein